MLMTKNIKLKTKAEYLKDLEIQVKEYEIQIAHFEFEDRIHGRKCRDYLLHVSKRSCDDLYG